MPHTVFGFVLKLPCFLLSKNLSLQNSFSFTMLCTIKCKPRVECHILIIAYHCVRAKRALFGLQVDNLRNVLQIRITQGWFGWNLFHPRFRQNTNVYCIEFVMVRKDMTFVFLFVVHYHQSSLWGQCWSVQRCQCICAMSCHLFVLSSRPNYEIVGLPHWHHWLQKHVAHPVVL